MALSEAQQIKKDSADTMAIMRAGRDAQLEQMKLQGQITAQVGKGRQAVTAITGVAKSGTSTMEKLNDFAEQK